MKSAILVLCAVMLAGCGGGARIEVPAPVPGASVLLVTIDTLRADSLGAMGNREVRTPAIDRLAAEGALFEFAHAHAVVTLPSHVSILTGLLPFEHGVRDNAGFRLADDVPTLATRLKARGYATAAFVGAFPLDARFGLARGFEVYDDQVGESSGSVDFAMAERRAEDVVGPALGWLDRPRAAPFFLWVHVYDPHAPYAPPGGANGDPYLAEVSYTDRALAPLFERARSLGRTLIVVTSDHGEARGDHGEATHGLFAYEATLHVPLLLHLPGAIPAVRPKDTVGHVDLAPTVLSLLGLEPLARSSGRSLLPLLGSAGGAAPAPLYFEALSPYLSRGWAPLRGLLVGREKWIDLPIPELYDLAADPRETANLAARQEARFAEGRARLHALAGRDIAAAALPVDAETAEKLRSLGYLGGAGSARSSFGAEDDPKRLIALDRALHDAIDAWERGDRARAEALLRGAIAARPDLAVARIQLGFVLHATGRGGEAIGELERALEGRPAQADALALLGNYLVEAGRPEEALRRLAPFAGSGGDLEVRNAHAIALAAAGREAEAARELEAILALDPSHATALQNLGTLALGRGDLDAAASFLDQALALDPKLARAWNGRGVVRARKGDVAGAIESWTRAVALDAQAWDTLYNLGILCWKEGRRDEARRWLARFVQGAPRAAYAADIAELERLLGATSTP